MKILCLCLSLLVFTACEKSRKISSDSFEEIPDSEAEAITKITEMIKTQVQAQYSRDSFATRDAHAKAHGCVKAKFTVNSDIPQTMHTKLLQPGKTYEAWVRYSNGSGERQADSNGDGRGMAIKVLGVPGDKILESQKNASTQDFLMINHDVFFIRNAADYVDFNIAMAQPGKTAEDKFKEFAFPSWNPIYWRLKEAKIAKAIQGKIASNPLAIQYFSMTPYRLNSLAAKYSAAPCESQLIKPENLIVDVNNKNYLYKNMAAHLKDADSCFDFFVQEHLGDDIEDARAHWNGNFLPVAKILITKQDFSANAEICENLSFTPWHSLPEHAPLGGINRVRLAVYQTISALRHELNHASTQEP